MFRWTCWFAAALGCDLDPSTAGLADVPVGVAIDTTDRLGGGWAFAHFAGAIIAGLTRRTAIVILALGLGTVLFVPAIGAVVIAVAHVFDGDTGLVGAAHFVVVTLVLDASAFVAIVQAICEAVTATDAWDTRAISAGELSIVTSDRATIRLVSSICTLRIVVAGRHAATIVGARGTTLGARTLAVTGRHGTANGQV